MSVSSTLRETERAGRVGRIAGLAMCAALLLGGCAEVPKEPEARAAYEEANDPLEPANRAIFDANLTLYDYVLEPTVKAYRVVPEPARKGLHNIIETVRSPALFANYIMQGDIDAAGDTALRMIINLTAGVGGFFDVAASQGGVEMRDTDFGVTLGKWGVGEQFYLVLPVLGPSNPRDGIGLAADSALDPVGYFTSFTEDVIRFGVGGIDKLEPNIDPLDEIRRTSVDFYATSRSLYRQRREAAIRGGGPGGNVPAPAISQEGTPGAAQDSNLAARPAPDAAGETSSRALP